MLILYNLKISFIIQIKEISMIKMKIINLYEKTIFIYEETISIYIY